MRGTVLYRASSLDIAIHFRLQKDQKLLHLLGADVGDGPGDANTERVHWIFTQSTANNYIMLFNSVSLSIPCQ